MNGNREIIKGQFLTSARFKLAATVEAIDYEQTRGISQSQMTTLAVCDWIRSRQNRLITGKSWLSSAFGHTACLRGYNVCYWRISRLQHTLTMGHGDGSHSKQLRQLARVDLLILDDWGLEAISQRPRNDLLKIMDDRHNHSSTIGASRLPVSGGTTVPVM